MLALKWGYIPKGNLKDTSISSSCDKEDSSKIKCRVKKDAPEKNVRGALAYIYKYEKESKSPEALQAQNLTRSQLYDTADEKFDEFFQKYRDQGITCDFGGTGILEEESKEGSEDEGEYYSFADDDEYYRRSYQGPKIWVIIVSIAAATFVLTSMHSHCHGNADEMVVYANNAGR